MFKFLIFLILFCGMIPQNNGPIISDMYANIDSKLADDEVICMSETDEFLMTFLNEQQIDNAELAEWRNELLFELLDKQTDSTIKSILSFPKHKRKLIYRELSQPVSDSIDLQQLYVKVQMCTMANKAILHALRQSMIDR